MSNIEQAQRRVAEAQRQLEDAMKELESAQQEGPSHDRHQGQGGIFFYAQASGWLAVPFRENGDRVARDFLSVGNYFLKRKHAEAKVRHDSRWGQIERYLIELNDGWEPDWSDAKQVKAQPCWSRSDGEWFVAKTIFFEAAGSIYVSEANGQVAIEYLNKHFPRGPKA